MEGTTHRRQAEPCPFCGEQPEIRPWHGGGPGKHMVSCAGESCDVQPSVTGESAAEALARWNRRAPSGPADVAALREALSRLRQRGTITEAQRAAALAVLIRAAEAGEQGGQA